MYAGMCKFYETNDERLITQARASLKRQEKDEEKDEEKTEEDKKEEEKVAQVNMRL